MRLLGLSLCGVVCESLLLCSVVVTAKWVVSCPWIMCIQPLSRCSLPFLASSFEGLLFFLSTIQSFFF